MNTIASLTSGLVSAVALTLLHQTLKSNVSYAPRMDKLGMEVLDKAGVPIKSKEKKYYTTMAADIAGNAGYYSMVGQYPEHSVLAGTALGIMAGLGAIALPEKMGLNKKHSNATTKTKLLTIGLYTSAGLIAGIVHKLLDKKG